MQKILFISLGAIVGANLRYFLGQYVAELIPASFPYGTLVINFSASFILGFFLVLAGERVPLDLRWRLLIAVGFCGGYSTYSSYAFETYVLYEKGQWMAAALNIGVMNVLCFAAVFIGGLLARIL